MPLGYSRNGKLHISAVGIQADKILFLPHGVENPSDALIKEDNRRADVTIFSIV